MNKKLFFSIITIFLSFLFIGCLKNTDSSSQNNNINHSNKNDNINHSSRTADNNSSDAKESKIPKDYLDNGIFSDYYEKAYKKLKSMTLEEKIGQLIFARCPSENAEDIISKHQFGGVILFGTNTENKTKEQLSRDISSLQNISKIPMLIGVDEEGGTVVRISSNPNLRSEKFKSPQATFAEGGFDKIALDTKEKCELLNSLGINVNLAPVADVSTDPNDFIYNRSFGQDAEKTADFVERVVKTSSENNISSVLKHFPGYGNNTDTHTGIAIDNRDYSTFEASDFIPFKRGIDSKVQGILVSHNIVKCMDENYPASLSASVHNILRDKLGFTGVIMTDDHAMDAISLYTNGEDAAVSAILAGNDLLILSDYETSYNNLLSSVGNGKLDLSTIDRAVFRILAWKYSMNIIR